MTAKHAGFLHQYTERLVAFEHTPQPGVEPTHTLLFVPGLGDGLLTVPYASQLALRLSGSWRVVEVLLGSSYRQWGFSSIQRDVKDIADCVKYFQNLYAAGKVVLMGHSTGSQDVLSYVAPNLTGTPSPPAVQGAILQAPVSDRESLEWLCERGALSEGELEDITGVAKQMVGGDEGEGIMTLHMDLGIFGAPCSARRWLSLVSPDHNGEDDLFSSDLPDAQLRRTFGSVPAATPLCILYSECDEHVPDHVDKKALVERWIDIAKQGGATVDELNSGVVPGASHNLKEDPYEVIEGLFGRVARFLDRVASSPAGAQALDGGSV